jgi:WS/DGAT/MGAT family acyltransferase
MQQLSGLDASFLYFETPNARTHIGGFAIYDPEAMPEGRMTYERLLATIESRLHLARCYRQKLVRVPLDLDHPYWVEDPEFDLEYHLRHIALPKPGNWRQLWRQASRLHSQPLDLSRPLWEMYLIDGLDEIPDLPRGSFALFTKIHHAAIDGVSGAELIAAIHDDRPDATPAPPAKRWVPERDPGAPWMLAHAAWSSARSPFHLARLIGRTIPGIQRYRDEQRRSTIEEAAPCPRTRFNGAVTPHRTGGGVWIDLGEVREIRKTVTGATVNDVIVTICGGALRKYLEAHGELPAESLIAMAPISVRSEDERGTAGNRVSTMLLPVRSDVADPAERLNAVHEATSHSKKLTGAIGARLLSDYTQFVPGTLAGLAARASWRLGLANRVRPFLNTVITNVPGPSIPLYMGGARLVANYGQGPVMDGMGLIHPIFSYAGKVTISFTSCRELLPDPELYEDCLRGAFEELRAATIGAPAEPSAPLR